MLLKVSVVHVTVKNTFTVKLIFTFLIVSILFYLHNILFMKIYILNYYYFFLIFILMFHDASKKISICGGHLGSSKKDASQRNLSQLDGAQGLEFRRSYFPRLLPSMHAHRMSATRLN